MFKRLLKLPKNQSFFLFGPRGSGKSTLIKKCFDDKSSLWIDLLDLEQEERLSLHPQELAYQVKALKPGIRHVVIDEVQKIPKLLDVVHSLIETTNKYFILTGSSARKLKHGGANLLAGRAFIYNLFPFSFLELGNNFNLYDALIYGMLPKVQLLENTDEKNQFLRAYTRTYLKEEIWAEQFIRKIDPFRKFLEVAAQCNGKIINYTNIANDVGVNNKTVKEYFLLLEDTLLGFFLEPFQHSFRKRLSLKPKFYFFDTGIVRALTNSLSIQIRSGTSAYGEIFEHFIILECMKLASYFKPDYRFSYLKTKDDAEVDLVIERPGLPILFIEIKSSEQVSMKDLRTLREVKKGINNCEAVCLSNDKLAKNIEGIDVLPWQEGIKTYFAD
jgi:predicted AAA+ superfamily ATPase